MDSAESLGIARHELATTSYVLPEKFIGFDEVYTAYEDSVYGKHHKGQKLRYSEFPYNDDMKKTDLGPDVEPVPHMFHEFRTIVNPAIAEQVHIDKKTGLYLPSEDIIPSRLAAILHDEGECTHPDLIKVAGRVIDDMPTHLKTKEDKEVEAKIRDHIFGEVFGFLPDTLLERTEEIIAKKDESDPAAKFFQAAEHLGFYRTGLKAADRLAISGGRAVLEASLECEEPTELDMRIIQLGLMAVRVPNAVKSDLEWAREGIPLIDRELKSTIGTMGGINKFLLPTVVRYTQSIA